MLKIPGAHLTYKAHDPLQQGVVYTRLSYVFPQQDLPRFTSHAKALRLGEALGFQTGNLVTRAHQWGQQAPTHLPNLVTPALMHSVAHAGYFLWLNDDTWQSQ